MNTKATLASTLIGRRVRINDKQTLRANKGIVNRACGIMDIAGKDIAGKTGKINCIISANRVEVQLDEAVNEQGWSIHFVNSDEIDFIDGGELLTIPDMTLLVKLNDVVERYKEFDRNRDIINSDDIAAYVKMANEVSISAYRLATNFNRAILDKAASG